MDVLILTEVHHTTQEEVQACRVGEEGGEGERGYRGEGGVRRVDGRRKGGGEG